MEVTYDLIKGKDIACDLSGIDNPFIWFWEKAPYADVYSPTRLIPHHMEPKALEYFSSVLGYVRTCHGDKAIENMTAEQFTLYMQEYNNAFQSFFQKFITTDEETKTKITECMAAKTYYEIRTQQMKRQFSDTVDKILR